MVCWSVDRGCPSEAPPAATFTEAAGAIDCNRREDGVARLEGRAAVVMRFVGDRISLVSSTDRTANVDIAAGSAGGVIIGSAMGLPGMISARHFAWSAPASRRCRLFGFCTGSTSAAISAGAKSR
jgi:hypothetical protein